MNETHSSIPVIAVVGGVGSGKSTIARGLAERRSVLVVDGDRVGHQALVQPEIKQAVRERFGDTVFNSDGEIERQKLGQLVWGSEPEKITARKNLEAIVHPWIRAEFQRTIAEAKDSGKYEAVILDAAVLLESGWNDICDTIVFIDTPLEARQQRVEEQRNWTETQLEQRERSQFSLEEKRSLCQETIKNNSSVMDAVLQFERILNRIILPFE